MNEEKFRRMQKSEGESELCDLIIATLDEAEQNEARKANALNKPGVENHDRYVDHYWRALALKHAITYVEDWKSSL